MVDLDLFDKMILVGDREGLESLTRMAIKEGVSVSQIINEHLIPAMVEVGRQYEEGELFIPEMLQSARAMQAGMALAKPLIVGDEIRTAGRVVIGTVKGDVHDIGKTLVTMMLEAAGFDVIDLGIDVEAARFVDAARNLKPDIIAMSAMLTTTMLAMQSTVSALQKAGLRGDLLVMVGGAPLTQQFADTIGADGYAEDAIAAAKKARELAACRRGNLGFHSIGQT
jgi:5-methyltetrahydrofolate--homocysteine methyltransferase